MSENYEDVICTRCWGARTVRSTVEPNIGCSVQCPRCKGTGEEPDNFPGWWFIGAVVVILVVFLFAQWSLPQ